MHKGRKPSTLTFNWFYCYIYRLINKIKPNSVKRVNKKGGKFALMENIEAFQKGVVAYGVPEEEKFQTVDLYEARNVKAVVKCLMALGRTVSFTDKI